MLNATATLTVFNPALPLRGASLLRCSVVTLDEIFAAILRSGDGSHEHIHTFGEGFKAGWDDAKGTTPTFESTHDFHTQPH